MDKSEFAKQFLPTFLDELHEHVEAINRDLLLLEQDPPAEQRQQTLRVLFRSAHSLKGAARAMNIDVMERACHLSEDILAEVREDKRIFTPDIFRLFFNLADALEEAGMRLREEQDLTGGPLHALIPQLETVAGTESSPDDRESDATVIADGIGPADAIGAQTDVRGPKSEVRGRRSEHGGQKAEDRKQEAEGRKPKAGDGKAVQPEVAEKSISGETRSPAAVETVKLAASSASTSIRVAAEKLDAMLAQSGELLVARRRIEQRTEDAVAHAEWLAGLLAKWRDLEPLLQELIAREKQRAGGLDAILQFGEDELSGLQQIAEQLARSHKNADRMSANLIADARILQHTCDGLDDEIHRVRMLPFAEACGGLRRAVRDIAQATGKDVRLSIEGEDVEVDRSVLEGLKDPLLHLVRNAVDHGMESLEERVKAGKPAQGHVRVSAALHGGQVEVLVSDDGRGFDLDRIREKAQKRNLPVPQDESELARLVFAPGFSTAAIVTDVSGRGVGLDVVESRIQSLHGAVDVKFETGVGTQFSMTLPLTLTTIRCLLAEAGRFTYAIPTSNVVQIVRFEQTSVRSVHGRDVLPLADKPISLSVLADVLEQGKRRAAVTAGKLLAVILRSGEQTVALMVDNLCTEQEVLVKNLGTRVRRARLVSGTTLLASGDIALVLNAGNVIRKAVGVTSVGPKLDQPEAMSSVHPRRLLVVDDSMTTRALMKNILQTAGYEVTAAVDGQHAWELLSQQPVDLVVSDVDMPRMNGFELTATIRGSGQFEDLPIILVTARSTDEDRRQGVRSGANAYLVKSSFDQGNLLETVQQML